MAVNYETELEMINECLARFPSAREPVLYQASETGGYLRPSLLSPYQSDVSFKYLFAFGISYFVFRNQFRVTYCLIPLMRTYAIEKTVLISKSIQTQN